MTELIERIGSTYHNTVGGMSIMLQVDKIGAGIYKVTETIMSFHSTDITYWYYDLNKQIMSEKEDFPDTMHTRNMDQYKVDWLLGLIKRKG